MSVQVSDVITDVRNFARNQNLTDTRVISAINTAIDFVSAHLGLPGHERQYTFDYFETQPFVQAPSDFEEPISLRYDEDRLNRYNRFHFRPPEFLYERIDAVDSKTSLWSYEFSSGIKKLIVLSRNSTAGIMLDSFDSSANDWIGSNDATNLENDAITYKEGAGSLRFDVNVSLSPNDKATLTRTFTNGFDLSTMNDQGYFFVDVYIPNITNFSSITLSWGSDAANYWAQTVTTQSDGSAFVVGWNTIALPWYGSSLIGTPDETHISWFKFDFSYTASYVSSTGFRIDYLIVRKPDKMIASYYTIYRGKNASGTYLSKFTDPTDVFLFGDFDPALRQLVSIHAAVVINPQILVENTTVSRLYSDFFTLYSRKYPKKRINNLMVDPSVTKTSYD
jgi:hypothetical protein